jgi:streptomycin 6-kinase
MEAPISCNFHCRRLARHWRGCWPGTDPAKLAADILERLTVAQAAWDLSGLEPLDGGVAALTCAATRGGRPVVLKLNPRGHPDDAQLAAEGDALAFWRPTGAAVELLGQRDGGFTLLMERLQPGHTLDDAGPSPEHRLTELGRLASRLHRAGPPPESFLHVRDFLGGPLPEGDQEVLVHLDLHGGNALRAGSAWKAIDPKGVRADRHADVWALIDPVMLEQLPKDAAATAERWVSRYAHAAEMDPEKVRKWTRVRALAEAPECAVDPEEAAWIAALHRMADALG